MQDVLGKSLFTQFKLADEQGKIIPKDLRPIRLALTTAQVGHGIYFLVKKGTGRIPLFITSAPVVLDGRVVGAVNIYRDVSQQVATDRAKDEFLYFASHTLRTPLSAVAWSIERLNEDNTGYSSEQRKFLDRIYDQTQRMIKLTNDLLDATRMEFGILSYKYEEVNPAKIASNVIADLKNRINDKKIKFKLIADKNISAYQTYSNAVYMILHNLLSNAVKFTPAGGTVSLKISKTEKELILQVSDSGVGIPKLAQGRIFQKMYRAQNVKDKFEGSGLGLYITSGIINHMGGKITVKSRRGQGTTFTVMLPFELEVIQSKEKDRMQL
ncbi:MAG: multi-sensor signal transduction histidine kinase [uncultured bacterium]|nr:MAG: multi-sensor signal transduction histidine kinase [uncultured bacterium]